MNTHTSTCKTCGSRGFCAHKSSKHSWKDDLSALSNEITEPERLLTKMSTPNIEVSMSQLTDSQVFIKCNFCESNVLQTWLTEHIFRHAESNFISGGSAITSNSSSTPRPSFVKKEKEPEVAMEPIIESEVREFLNTLPPVKIKDHDGFAFRTIKDVSITSSSSKISGVSDISLTVWFPETTSTHNGGFTGMQSHYGKRNERLQINLCYDSVEDFFTLTGTCYGRSSYSEFDTIEGQTPMRALRQEELAAELRGCLLFHRVAPKSIYFLLRKNMRNLSILPIKDKEGREYLASSNHKALSEVKSASYTTGWTYGADDE